MFRTLIVAATTLAIGVVGLSSAYAETMNQPAPTTTTADAAKTSDRTPGDVMPDRTPGASNTGAAGTAAAQTSEGTSDRTPSAESTPKSSE